MVKVWIGGFSNVRRVNALHQQGLVNAARGSLLMGRGEGGVGGDRVPGGGMVYCVKIFCEKKSCI
jgi:hypothetical protein